MSYQILEDGNVLGHDGELLPTQFWSVLEDVLVTSRFEIHSLASAMEEAGASDSEKDFIWAIIQDREQIRNARKIILENMRENI